MNISDANPRSTTNVELNANLWGRYYDWAGAGEEWSVVWGGSHAQWLGSLYPRISAFLPTESILEIAPGYGRWTQFLLSACSRYWGVELSQQCTDACKNRFRDVKHASFVTNDGMLLVGVPDKSVDFVFSFDSLVHASAEVVASYVREILRVLKRNGIAFIHHSNWLEVSSRMSANTHGRAVDVSADGVRHAIQSAGGGLLVQEKINWGFPDCTDCLSLFGHLRDKQPLIIENHDFMQEARNIREHQSPYVNLGLREMPRVRSGQ